MPAEGRRGPHRHGERVRYDAPLLRGTMEVNRRQRVLLLAKLGRELKVLKGRRIGVLGLAFKLRPAISETHRPLRSSVIS